MLRLPRAEEADKFASQTENAYAMYKSHSVSLGGRNHTPRDLLYNNVIESRIIRRVIYCTIMLLKAGSYAA